MSLPNIKLLPDHKEASREELEAFSRLFPNSIPFQGVMWSEKKRIAIGTIHIPFSLLASQKVPEIFLNVARDVATYLHPGNENLPFAGRNQCLQNWNNDDRPVIGTTLYFVVKITKDAGPGPDEIFCYQLEIYDSANTDKAPLATFSNIYAQM